LVGTTANVIIVVVGDVASEVGADVVSVAPAVIADMVDTVRDDVIADIVGDDVIVCVDGLPSVVLVDVALSCGVESSSRIEARPVPSAIVALTALESVTAKVSVFSFVVSPTTLMVMVPLGLPAGIVRTPEAPT
jgi:hypothetical protein